MSESVYVHVPFCLKKCPYCDFYSIEALSLIPDYVTSLQREIKIRSALSSQLSNPLTIYFGGGTPSLLPIKVLGQILETIDQGYGISKQAEITLEINPGTADKTYLTGLRTLGINRLSLGIQSFDPGKIALLNRVHTIDQSIEIIEAAIALGFDNIGLDLMYGLPRETLEIWIQDIEKALEFKPVHLSCYMLTLEPGTPLNALFQQKMFHPQSKEALADLFVATSLLLEQRGYEHYEISNFSRKRENRSQHNSAYWNYTAYAGFGPSAHSFYPGEPPAKGTLPRAVRSWNLSDVRVYGAKLSMGELPIQETETLSPAQQMLERVMLGLRTRDGLDINGFQTVFGLDFFKEFKGLIDRLETQGFAVIVPGFGLGKKRETEREKQLQLTRAGWARLDSIVEAFAQIIL